MASGKIALENVRVFDGDKLCEPSTVIIDGPLIGDDAQGAKSVDCHGSFLLPGFIDSHLHLHEMKNLEQLRNNGVTTALDMASMSIELIDSLRGHKGLPDVRSAGIPATTPGSIHSQIPGIPEAALLTSHTQAEKFVADRVAEGSDYIKIISDVPGPDQALIDALVTAAHHHQKLVIAHAAAFEPYRMAQDGKVDFVTHAPIDKALGQTEATRMAQEGRIAIPTLAMMQGIVKAMGLPVLDYAHARASVAALYAAGVPVLVGTDANNVPGIPSNPPHGKSFHQELELLVDAGLSTRDALRGATSLAARYFGLQDRGVIAPGRRADLILISADPLQDIRATRQIERVWCAGVEYVAPSA
ncbi:hypothetical protein MMC19_007133 [Ptychographa xylographoides]|nr:hypothetical protein [Ptychographa xylographoides]